MAILILGLVLFLGVHSVNLFAPQWRKTQIARLGKGPWKGLFTLVSLVGFGLIIWGYGQARTEPVWLWSPPTSLRHVAVLLMLLAFILLAASKVPGTFIKSRVGHPMLLGVKTWAVAHLLSNGALADIVLFGSFLVWGVALYVVLRRRDRVRGRVYAAQGLGRDTLAGVIGLALWAAFAFYLHEWLFGMPPLS